MSNTKAPQRTAPKPVQAYYVNPQNLQYAAVPPNAPQRTVAGPKRKRVKPKMDSNTDRVFARKGMTIEDKLFLLMQRLMTSFNKQVEKQIEKVEKLQTANEAKADKNGNVGNVASTGMDVETATLKRLTDKREQLFTMLTGLMKRYNATAQGVLRDLGQA